MAPTVSHSKKQSRGSEARGRLSGAVGLDGGGRGEEGGREYTVGTRVGETVGRGGFAYPAEEHRTDLPPHILVPLGGGAPREDVANESPAL